MPLLVGAMLATAGLAAPIHASLPKNQTNGTTEVEYPCALDAEYFTAHWGNYYADPDMECRRLNYCRTKENSYSPKEFHQNESYNEWNTCRLAEENAGNQGHVWQPPVDYKRPILKRDHATEAPPYTSNGGFGVLPPLVPTGKLPTIVDTPRVPRVEEHAAEMGSRCPKNSRFCVQGMSNGTLDEAEQKARHEAEEKAKHKLYDEIIASRPKSLEGLSKCPREHMGGEPSVLCEPRLIYVGSDYADELQRLAKEVLEQRAKEEVIRKANEEVFRKAKEEIERSPPASLKNLAKCPKGEGVLCVPGKVHFLSPYAKQLERLATEKVERDAKVDKAMAQDEARK